MNAEREMINDVHCRELWLIVIHEAIRQAIVEKHYKKKRKDGRGRSDFLSGGGSMPWICCQLGYDLGYMVRKIKEIVENPQSKEFYLIRDLRGWL
jgi:hypothetical protein